ETTSPSTPPSSMKSTSRAVPSRSIAPPWNGVTIATISPSNMSGASFPFRSSAARAPGARAQRSPPTRRGTRSRPGRSDEPPSRPPHIDRHGLEVLHPRDEVRHPGDQQPALEAAAQRLHHQRLPRSRHPPEGDLDRAVVTRARLLGTERGAEAHPSRGTQAG